MTTARCKTTDKLQATSSPGTRRASQVSRAGLRRCHRRRPAMEVCGCRQESTRHIRKRADACAHSITRIPVRSSPSSQSVDYAHAHSNTSAEPVESIAAAEYGRIQPEHVWDDGRRTAAVVYSATGCASSSSTETIRISGSGSATRSPAAPAAPELAPTTTSAGRIPYPRHSTAYIPLCASPTATLRETKFDV